MLNLGFFGHFVIRYFFTYQVSTYVFAGRMLFILNQDIKSSNLVSRKLKYEIEIELPSSGAWFKYFTGIDSLEEAETIKSAAEGNVNARIMQGA